MTPTPIETVLQRAPAPTVGMDDHGRITFWNRRAEDVFGVSAAAALGRELAAVIVPERHRAAHRSGLRRALAGGGGRLLHETLELTGLRADGSEFPLQLTVTAALDDDRPTYYGFISDLTDQRSGEREHARLVEELRRALHGSRRRFDAIVGSLTDAVTIRDREHQFVYANRAAIEHLGFADWDEMRASSPDRVMADYIVLGDDRRPISMQDIPSVRLLRGERAEPLVIETVHRRTGDHRWNLLKSAPLLDENGEIEATLMIIQDITERRRVEQQALFLTRAGDVLSSSLDYEQTLRNVAWLAVPGLADWCAVDLVDERGRRVPVAVAHIDPERVRLAEELRTYEPEELDPEQGLGRVLATGEPELYREITDEMLVASAVDDRHLELLRRIGFSAAMVTPILLGDRTLGAMTLVSAESRRPLDEFDLRTAQQAAARAAVAIENARLYSERSQIAHALQQSLLPEKLPDIPGYGLASIYIPALAGTEVGGDFYDVWETDGGWMIAVGDVTGKGPTAAALTGVVRHTLRVAAEFSHSPAQLLSWVDWALKKRPDLSLCTAVCVRLDADRATLAVGGHPLPLLVGGGAVTAVGVNGPLLGGFDKVGWQDATVPLTPGAALVAYTDGVTDAVGADGARFGQARLRAVLAAGADSDAESIVAGLRAELERFQSGGHADDTAVLALHRHGPPAPAPAPAPAP